MRHRILRSFVAFALALVYVPLVSVVLFSFDKSSAPIMPIRHLTFSWYGVLWHDSDLRQALETTLKVGAITVVCVLSVATLAAFALRGRQFTGRGIYEAVIGLPFLLPEVVVGISLLTWMSTLEISLSIKTIILGHVLFCLGAGFRIIAGRVETLPRSLEEAARDLGCGPFRTFRLVIVPAMRSGLLTAGLLVFALSFDQTIITILLSGTENTLPTLLWAKLRIGVTPEVNALATVILLVSFIVAVPLGLRAGRKLAG